MAPQWYSHHGFREPGLCGSLRDGHFTERFRALVHTTHTFGSGHVSTGPLATTVVGETGATRPLSNEIAYPANGVGSLVELVE